MEVSVPLCIYSLLQINMNYYKMQVFILGFHFLFQKKHDDGERKKKKKEKKKKKVITLFYWQGKFTWVYLAIEINSGLTYLF